ncbi:MAG: GIY-YIG nuclease family protein [Bacteroidetes bacterium]|nr:GIY-YIG nuclease family protein [Bacteroidota bacterium]
MKRLLVYIVKCSDDSYYTGVTNNIDRRLNEHNCGHSPSSYTSSRRPVELVFYEIFDRPLEAIDFEKKLKGWSRAKKEALINSNWDKLKHHAICKNETSHLNYKQSNAHTSTPLSVTDTQNIN